MPTTCFRSFLVLASLALLLMFLPLSVNPTTRAYAASGSTVGSAATDYARVIRLEHSSSSSSPDGTLIAATDTDSAPGFGTPDQGFPVFKSSDNGQSWSQIATVNSGAGTFSCCVAIFEMPQQLGNFPAGTLLLGGTTQSGATIAVWESGDQGADWTFLSNCATGGQGNGQGLWEPEFAVDSSGNLVCYFSDERHQSDGYSQLLGHVVSTDGGVTWGAETYDVAVNDNNTRPGMARVVKLPNGSYMMAYEVCGNPGCTVHVRTSSDGDNWGTASNLGTQVYASDGSYFVSSPGLAWSPAGGPNGELLLVGKTLLNSPGGGSGSTLFVTTDLSGTGTWYRIPAPVSVNVPGDGNHCANYSTSLLPSLSGTSVLELTGTDTSSDTCAIVAGASNAGTLPYYASFDSGTDAGWNTYGGSWSVSNGVYSDTSYSGQGDKSVAGSTGWTDYTLTGDVELTQANTDAGFLVRVNNPSLGTDSLSGYVVGIAGNGSSGTLYLGRETNGSWSTLSTTAISGGVSANAWYHLSIQAVGCTFTVSVQNVASSTLSTLEYTDSGCYTSGQIGIRTHNGTAAWRNISVVSGGTSSTSVAPYYATFASGSAADWNTYGGSWSVSNETYGDTSYSGQGDKAVAGSTSWGNYALTGDVELTSPNTDSGFLVRVNNPSLGIDALSGYVIGIAGDSSGGTLYLGREINGSWSTLTTTPTAGGVPTNSWYHLSIQVSGCTLTISAQSTSSADQSTITYSDCTYSSGQIGIRTHNGTATWRNISVTPQ